ncbi:hypothetical protein PIECOFPK_02761 [Mycovorax composti]|uniref:Carboxymuconolactone decarboxylase-like domain-containing protein n=2 Tax=Mycovorax composti TaxID=2962693 RepID=A0ABZ2ENJ3_9BACT
MRRIALRHTKNLNIMAQRFNIRELAPKAYEKIFTLEDYLKHSELDPVHFELIKIRGSQINGCAFCIDKHTKDALDIGETPRRIFLLDAWKETGLFTDEERIILAMTEEITLIKNQGLTEATCQEAKKYFSDHYIAHIIMAIVTINAWNRIAISSRMDVK